MVFEWCYEWWLCNTSIAEPPPLYLICWNQGQVSAWIDDLLTEPHYNETIVLEIMQPVDPDVSDTCPQCLHFRFFFLLWMSCKWHFLAPWVVKVLEHFSHLNKFPLCSFWCALRHSNEYNSLSHIIILF